MKHLYLLLIFFLCHLTYQAYNMYVAKHSHTHQFLNWKFENDLTYTVVVLLAFTPVLSLANLGFGLGYSYGYKEMSKNIWLISILFICAQMIATLLTAHFILQSEFQKGPIIGFGFALTGLLIANLWK